MRTSTLYTVAYSFKIGYAFNRQSERDNFFFYFCFFFIGWFFLSSRFTATEFLSLKHSRASNYRINGTLAMLQKSAHPKRYRRVGKHKNTNTIENKFGKKCLIFNNNLARRVSTVDIGSVDAKSLVNFTVIEWSILFLWLLTVYFSCNSNIVIQCSPSSLPKRKYWSIFSFTFKKNDWYKQFIKHTIMEKKELNVKVSFNGVASA